MLKENELIEQYLLNTKVGLEEGKLLLKQLINDVCDIRNPRNQYVHMNSNILELKCSVKKKSGYIKLALGDDTIEDFITDSMGRSTNIKGLQLSWLDDRLDRNGEVKEVK